MKPRLLYKNRLKYTAGEFELVRLYEDGTVLQNHYTHNQDYLSSYRETNELSFQVKGTILLQEVTFDKDHKRKNTDLLKHTKTIDSFSEKDYIKAHQALMKYHDETLDNLSVDYRLMFELDFDSLTEETPIPKEVKTYPITYFRATTNVSEIERKKHPENLAIRFVPTMNESLYFHYIPANDHITMTGDELFALATRQVDKKLSEQEFVDFIDEMVQEVKEKESYYLSLIVSQRKRRASLETDEMGDLYPR